jgi:predicted membrane protein
LYNGEDDMKYRGSWRTIGGLLLVLLGLLFLLAAFDVIGFGAAWAIFWALVFILVGLFIIWHPRGNQKFHEFSQSGTMVGDIRLGDSEWDLKDMETSLGAGQLHLDLTRARIQSGETRLKVSGGMGKIEVLVPAGLAISVWSEVGAGSISILGQKADGVGRQATFATPGYDTADKRVRLELSLMMGEVSVYSLS